MNDITDSIVAKIKKLLELSTSDNPHESELALLHAKRLAAQHDVDITLIEIFGRGGNNQKEPIIKNDGINLGNRKSITQKYVSWLLQDHFNVKVIYTGSRQRGMSLVLIGRKDKIQIAEFVQSFLNHEFLTLWRNYYSNSGCDLSARDSYLMGLYRGLSDKLTKEQKDVENEKLAGFEDNTKQSYALMVVSEKDRITKAVQQFFPKLKNVSTKFNGAFSNDALNSGFVAGGKINIRRTIGNTCGNALIA